MNLSASPSLSEESTPTNATFLASCTAAFCMTGNSARQGPHQDAHLLTTTGWPFSEASRDLNALAPPFRSCPPSAWSEASAAGEPASALLLTAALGAALFGSDPQPATTAAQARAAAMQRFTGT